MRRVVLGEGRAAKFVVASGVGLESDDEPLKALENLDEIEGKRIVLVAELQDE